MSTTAVTQETPAVSTPAVPQKSEHAEFLPSNDRHYRMTGEIAEPEKSAVIEEAPAASAEPVQEATPKPGDDTAAASEAAPPQKKTAATSENRWQKITRENKELRERLLRFESAQQPPRETQQASQPAAEAKPEAKTAPKPKIDDVDPKTNQPKYKSYAEYEEAKDQWLLDEGARKATEALSKTTQERERAQVEQTIQKEVSERAEKARAAYPDYDDVMTQVLTSKEVDGRPPIFYTAGSPIDAFILKTPNGTDVLYHCAKNISNPAIREIFARNPQGNAYVLSSVEQVGRLAVLAHTLASKSAAPAPTPSAKPITQAPRPPHQTSGQGAVNKDPVVAAVETQDQETYMREQNARDLARRKKGK